MFTNMMVLTDIFFQLLTVPEIYGIQVTEFHCVCLKDIIFLHKCTI